MCRSLFPRLPLYHTCTIVQVTGEKRLGPAPLHWRCMHLNKGEVCALPAHVSRPSGSPAKEKNVERLSNSCPDVRLYLEGMATGPKPTEEDPYRRRRN